MIYYNTVIIIIMMHNYVAMLWLRPEWIINVTGFAKTIPNGTRIEIQFIADY